MSSFNNVCHELVDTWLHQKALAEPEGLLEIVAPRLSIRMALSVVLTEANDPYDWRFRRVKDFGFRSRMLDKVRGEFRDAKLGDMNRPFIDQNIVPIYSRAIDTRRPLIDRVSTKLLGIRIGYERLLIPQKHDGRPNWCISLIEGRFFMPPAPDMGTDLTDEEIIQLLIEGHTAKEIAILLSLSPRTVEHRIAALKDRFEARNLIHLVAKLVSRQLERQDLNEE